MVGPGHKRRAGAAPAEEIVLAAVARASLHRRAASASLRSVLAHLAVTPRSASARSVRLSLAALAELGFLVRGSRRGVELWGVTGRGRDRLSMLGPDAGRALLPEAPQLLAWRNARRTAARELPRLERALGEALTEGQRLLADGGAVHSDTWFELAGELSRAARRVGSAGHCLREWPEPDDARADRDERSEPGDGALDAGLRARRRLRAGRRNPLLWSGPGTAEGGR